MCWLTGESKVVGLAVTGVVVRISSMESTAGVSSVVDILSNFNAQKRNTDILLPVTARLYAGVLPHRSLRCSLLPRHADRDKYAVLTPPLRIRPP